jgi:hypothetical protein
VFTRLASAMLGLIERLFPLIPQKTPQEVGADWQSDFVYYGLGSTCPELRARLTAILCCNREVVSWYRRRQRLIRKLDALSPADRMVLIDGYSEWLAQERALEARLDAEFEQDRLADEAYWAEVDEAYWAEVEAEEEAWRAEEAAEAVWEAQRDAREQLYEECYRGRVSAS